MISEGGRERWSNGGRGGEWIGGGEEKGVMEGGGREGSERGGRSLFMGACCLFVRGDHQLCVLPICGGGSSCPWALIIYPWGLSSSMGGGVVAVPGHCLLWMLGHFLWAQGHCFLGG